MTELYQGDCIQVMKSLPDKSINLILTDLPYGTTENRWDSVIDFNDLWEQYNRLLTDNGTVLLFANNSFMPMVLNSNLKNYKYRLVWLKPNCTGFPHAKNRPLAKSEDILVFSKGSMGHRSLLGDRRMCYNPQGLQRIDKTIKRNSKSFGQGIKPRPSHKSEIVQEWTNYPTDVLIYGKDKTDRGLHPTQKPVALLEYLIKTYSNEGDRVLDNCMGSGSTGVACANTSRDFVGIELDTDYYNTAVERLERVQNAE